jgi:hypothetical protein
VLRKLSGAFRVFQQYEQTHLKPCYAINNQCSKNVEGKCLLLLTSSARHINQNHHQKREQERYHENGIHFYQFQYDCNYNNK